MNFGDSTAAKDNLLRSPSLYLTPRLRGPGGTPMLIVFGWGFASDPGSLVILTLDQRGAPMKVFQSDAFELTALLDLNRDGNPEVVGKRSLSQVWGRCFETYDPYAVYRLAGSPVPRAIYDTALSRAYNIAHYFGWAGPEAREDVAVVRCAPGGPRLMDTAAAIRQFDSH